MTTMPSNPTSSYVLGATSQEHDRLIRQAVILEPLTERLLLDAGIGPGLRVLDIGSGVGDVAMIAARLVGPSGAVVGVEREAATLSAARARVAKAGISNLSFIEADVAHVPRGEPYDAVVGRLILQSVPDPGAVVNSLAALVRPGGAMAFQDVWPNSLLLLNAHLPLRAKCAALIFRTFERAGVHMDMELVLFRMLQEAGLPAPNMRIEVPVGDDPNIVGWLHDLFVVLLPHMRRDELDAGELGDLNTLRSRLEAERVTANSFGACVGLVSVWSRKPD
jgi:ubiquinone/menaquinone biosynthesis C-methylase UbiE